MVTKICEWCGNTSGKCDTRGMCISCGGNLTIQTPKAWSTPWSECDHSGSSYFNIIGEAGKEVFIPRGTMIREVKYG